MNITIRRVTIDDVATLSAIAKQTFYDTFTGTCTEADMQSFLEEYFNETQLSKELNNPDDQCFFAVAEGKPIGYIRFMEDYRSLPLMKQWKALELKRIYILKEFHGMGIAQQLLDFMISYAKKENYQAIWLGVWEHNLRAQRFYEKYGFKNSGYKHDFPIGDTPQTDIWFWKFL
jgi:ribosomal protein S18 acetylase RimI-like enzyme